MEIYCLLAMYMQFKVMKNLFDIAVADVVELKLVQRLFQAILTNCMAIAFQYTKRAIEEFSCSYRTYTAIAFLLQGSNLFQCSCLLRNLNLLLRV